MNGNLVFKSQHSTAPNAAVVANSEENNVDDSITLILFVFQLLFLTQPLVTASTQISLTAASTFNAMVANYTIKGVPRDSYLIQKSRPVIGPRTWCAHKCSTGINTNDGKDELGFQWLNKNPQKYG